MELRRYHARAEAQVAAWALRENGVPAELRRVGRPGLLEEIGTSALLVPLDAVENARAILSSDRFRISDDEERQVERKAWFPASASDIELGLNEIERQGRVARLCLLSLVLVLIAGFLGIPEPFLSVLAIVSFVGVAFSQWRASAVDCPRCGLPFGIGRTWFGSWRAFSRRCLTCGLPRHILQE